MLFNANKAYDRQVVEGVGEYLQASQSEWDIFIEEDFRTRLENIKDWLGDGVIADFDDPVIEQLLSGVDVPIVGVGGSYHTPEHYPPVHYIEPCSGRDRLPPFKGERRTSFCVLRIARHQRKALGDGA